MPSAPAFDGNRVLLTMLSMIMRLKVRNSVCYVIVISRNSRHTVPSHHDCGKKRVLAAAPVLPYSSKHCPTIVDEVVEFIQNNLPLFQTHA
jgi:hypothetical protein